DALGRARHTLEAEEVTPWGEREPPSAGLNDESVRLTRDDEAVGRLGCDPRGPDRMPAAGARSVVIHGKIQQDPTRRSIGPAIEHAGLCGDRLGAELHPPAPAAVDRTLRDRDARPYRLPAPGERRARGSRDRDRHADGREGRRYRVGPGCHGSAWSATPASRRLTTTAGTPAAMTRSGMGRVTTEPAPTTD